MLAVIWFGLFAACGVDVGLFDLLVGMMLL